MGPRRSALAAEHRAAHPGERPLPDRVESGREWSLEDTAQSLPPVLSVDRSHRSGWTSAKLLRAGRYLFAIPLGLLGIQHFIFAGSPGLANIGPTAFRRLPGAVRRAAFPEALVLCNARSRLDAGPSVPRRCCGRGVSGDRIEL